MATGPLPVGLNSNGSHRDSSRGIVCAGQGIAENNTNCSCRCILQRAGAPSYMKSQNQHGLSGEGPWRPSSSNLVEGIPASGRGLA